MRCAPMQFVMWSTSPSQIMTINSDILGNATWVVSVSVMVVDQYGLTDTATAQVTVTDINNNAPKFSQGVYTANLYGS